MSKRGNSEVPSDRERAFAATVEETGDHSNVFSSSNSDTVSSAHDHDPHESLLTVGEKCVHLICAFIREFDCEGNSHGVKTSNGAVSLSRLSRTCRTLYIYVRNLPSVLESAVPPFSTQLLPWGTIGLDLGYWCDIAGLVWEVSDSRQLLLLVASISTRSASTDYYARLGNLFLHLPDLTGIDTLSDAKRAEVLHILERCGGLFFYLNAEASPIPGLGLDLRRCKNLKYLHVCVDVRKCRGLESYEALLGQLALMEEKPRYASISIMRADLGVLTDLSALSYFQCIRANAPADLMSLEGAQHARFVSLSNLRLTDVSSLAQVNTVELSHSDSITDVSALGSVHALRLSLCQGITDVSALSAVHKLDICLCHEVTNLDALPNLTRDRKVIGDFKGDLSGARSVDLSYCNDLTDVSMLGHVHTLNLAGCKALADVSALGGVHTLDLAGCKALADVSALGNVHTLDLGDCERITDVSMLGHVHTLSLENCSGVTDVSALGKVHTLTLDHSQNITDVSALGKVHTLSLEGCDWLTDVSPLATVHRLNLSHCNGITDVSSLENVTYLRLFNSQSVTNASTLINKVPYLVF